MSDSEYYDVTFETTVRMRMPKEDYDFLPGDFNVENTVLERAKYNVDAINNGEAMLEDLFTNGEFKVTRLIKADGPLPVEDE